MEEKEDIDGLLDIFLTPTHRVVTPTGNNTFNLSIRWEQHSSGNSNAEAREDAANRIYSTRRSTTCAELSFAIHAFTDEMDMAAPFVTARKVQTDVDSDHAHQQIRYWLEECGSHECCVQQSENILPTRVVEVAPDTCRDTPRLLITEGQKGKYVALSYCWGVEPYGLLSTSNMSRYTQGLDTDTLPQTFRDAIAVAKTMSIPYLWIDALCIIQDSEEDKTREVSLMERIYRESFVTIVAASSPNSTDGILRPRPPPQESYIIPFRRTGELFGSMSIQELYSIEYDEMLEPINQRAWTLQEQLIPNRFLIYASHTLQWRCNAGVKNLGSSLHHAISSDDERYCETLSFLRRPASKRKDQLTRWLRIIHIYSGRTASLATDKLPALAGIAKEFSNALGPRYYAGLWEHSLLLQLAWMTWLPRDTTEPPCTRPITYRGPSWSWASIEGRVSFPYHLFKGDGPDNLYRCSLVRCETMVKSSNSPFGEVLGASLKIKAVLRQAWLIPSKKNVIWLAGNNPSLAAAETLHLASFRQDNSKDTHSMKYPRKGFSYIMEGEYDVSGDWPPALVFTLPIITSEFGVFGLLLAPADNSTFKRVGWFNEGKTADFDHLQQIEITVI